MNNHTSSNIKIPSNTKYTWGGIGMIILLGAVALLGPFFYFIYAPVPLNSEIANERKAKLADVNAKQNELISNYAWIDQAKGIVRIPVERAMQITAQELQHPKTNNVHSKPQENKPQKTES